MCKRVHQLGFSAVQASGCCAGNLQCRESRYFGGEYLYGKDHSSLGCHQRESDRYVFRLLFTRLHFLLKGQSPVSLSPSLLLQAPTMIPMAPIFRLKLYRQNLKERGPCRDNSSFTKQFGQNSKVLFMPSMPWFAKLPMKFENSKLQYSF